MRGLPAPIEFVSDEAEEPAGGSWSARFVDLSQRLAQLHKVFCRHQGPSSEGVEYPVPASWTDPAGHAASLAARSGRRYP